MNRTRSRCQPETGRGISISIPMVAGSTPFRRKARPSSCLTTMPQRGGWPRGRRSPPCRPGLPAVISAPRSWFQPMGDSSMRATGCTTASGSFPLARTATSRSSGKNGHEGIIRAASTSTPLASSSIVAISAATTSPSSQVNRQTGGLKFTGHYAAVGNPSSIVFLDLAKAR